MKKKLVPILVILALVIVGVGGYMMGQANTPMDETPPAQNSTSDSSIEPVADTTTELSTLQAQPFEETLYTVYVKAAYIQNGNGVPVWDRYKMDASLGVNGMKKELFKTSANSGVPYVVVGVGYGDADGYIQVLDPTTGITGYSNEEWFTQEAESQKPAEQAPVEQQKPAEQTPVEQEQEKPAEQKPTDTGAGIEYYTPETSDRATLPLEYQTHYDPETGKYYNGLGEEVHTQDGTIGGHYTGNISG